MIVAIIPARGGSKRILGKNIKDFCGKPILAWSIEVAKASGCFDKVIVSTDDKDIAKIALQWGAEVPFIRPLELSDDYTPTSPVICHAIEWLEANEGKVDYACCIYATAPFIIIQDLLSGWRKINKSEFDYAFSVSSYSFPVQRALQINVNDQISMMHPEHLLTRSQDLPEAFHDAGQFYWGTSKAWCENKPIFGRASVPVKLPRHRVQDIDSLEDWTRAEWMFKSMLLRDKIF